MKILNWNTEWASPSSPRGRQIQEEIARQSPDLICITEGMGGILPEDGAVLESGPDYGYGLQAHRRKGMLWARDGFLSESNPEPEGMPPGRFVTGRLGSGLLVVGVCIPWDRAHVSSGARNRRPWEDHLAYLTALEPWLKGCEGPVLVIGDFNQTVPRSRAPVAVYETMTACFAGLEILTEGIQSSRPLIDHAVASPGIMLDHWQELPNLSDHIGWSAELHVPI